MADASPLAFLSVSLATFAIMFGTSGMVNCRAVKFTSSAGGGTEIEAGVFSFQTVGFYTTASSDTLYVVDVCSPYTDLTDETGFEYEEDSWMTTLQRIAITIPIIGGIALIGNCIVLCTGPPNPMVFKLFGLFYITCAILQGIGLKMMDSYICTNNPYVQYLEAEFATVGNQFQDDCTMSMGMRLNITAVVFWAVAGLASMAIAKKAGGDVPESAAAEEK